MDQATYSASLVTQGKHRFFTLTMPSDVLAHTCTVDTRDGNPMAGFQRVLDERRAREIAHYIDEGLGTIPTSIVLSAQASSNFQYMRSRRSVTFNKCDGAFLILDGQHRVFGFALANSRLRVPVVVYSGLTRSQECRLFMDINTKQRPVPNELLLDIKRLAETEDDSESFLREVFDRFNREASSPLVGLLSPASKSHGKISRVTFNAAVKSLFDVFGKSDPNQAYSVLSNYLHAWVFQLESWSNAQGITNATVFRAIVLLFPDVAQRVADRYDKEYSAQNFAHVLAPAFAQIKPSQLKKPARSPKELHDQLRKALGSHFTID